MPRGLFQATNFPNHRNSTARHIRTAIASSRYTASANRHRKTQYRSSFVMLAVDLCLVIVMAIQTSQGMTGGKKKPRMNNC